jgi:protein-S-isoprenylcysteine O-methyltransferase Ste14
MSRASAVIGSLVFFVLAPGLVSGLGPWLVSRWVVAPDAPTWWPVAAGLGGVLIVAGVAVLVSGFVRFVTEGRGTPAPVAPPVRLVTGGLYAWVRNPMYLANVAILFGQAAVFWRNDLVSYAFVVGGAMVAFVGVYEEPKLAATFGEQYAAYRSRVPGWWPRRPR